MGRGKVGSGIVDWEGGMTGKSGRSEGTSTRPSWIPSAKVQVMEDDSPHFDTQCLPET